MSRIFRAHQLIPTDTRIGFMRCRRIALAGSILFVVLTGALLEFRGLNLGLDFTGGILVEVKTGKPVSLGTFRTKLNSLGLGQVSLQTAGEPNQMMIRFQAGRRGSAAEENAVTKVKSVLTAGDEVLQTAYIGPKVSGELLRNGIYAALLSVICIGIYVWFRFEWQFGVSAIVATFHDVIATIGVFSLFGLEFNLTTIAALLTIAGYSINDTVVVFDRVRENLRQYKRMPLTELIDLSTNQTLSRTILTSGTTLIAVVTLMLLGGPVLRGFAIALTWGIVVGTYSSIFIANALLTYLPNVRSGGTPEKHARTDNA